MHSRIIEIKEIPTTKMSWKPISYYESKGWFMGTIADYVCEDDNREDSIEWFKGSLEGKCVTRWSSSETAPRMRK